MHIKSTVRYHLSQSEWLLSKSQQITSVGKEVEKREPSVHCWWDCKQVQSYGKDYEGSSENYKYIYETQNYKYIDTAIPLPCMEPKKKTKNINSKRYMHACVHHSIIYNSQHVEATQVSVNRQMDEEDVVHICNGILSNEKNEILPFAATQMDLEGIVLSEISQTKTNDTWIHLQEEF